MSGIVGPVALYNNFPINANYYEPSRFEITAITRGRTTTITTSDANNYVVGQQIRVLLPSEFGMYQINNQQGTVISIPASDQVEVTIDSSFYDAYVSATSTNVPQIIAIGDFNSGIIAPAGRVIPSTNIPGSFINISPE